MMQLPIIPNVPAGLIDQHIEFFADGHFIKATHNGKVNYLNELPASVLDLIEAELNKTPSAIKALDSLKISGRTDRLRIFLKCRFGGFDMQADFAEGELQETEYWDCGIRGKCQVEGKLCPSIRVQNGHLTRREIDVIRLVAEGMLDKEIADRLQISVHTVSNHKQNIENKTGLRSKVEIGVFAAKKNIV